METRQIFAKKLISVISAERYSGQLKDVQRLIDLIKRSEQQDMEILKEFQRDYPESKETVVVNNVIDSTVATATERRIYAHLNALQMASYRGYADIVSVLIKAGANPDVTQLPSGQTALFYAKNVDTAHILIDAGANLEVKDESGKTALSVVHSSFDIKNVTALLLMAGADVRSIGRMEYPCLMPDKICYHLKEGRELEIEYPNELQHAELEYRKAYDQQYLPAYQYLGNLYDKMGKPLQALDFYTLAVQRGDPYVLSKRLPQIVSLAQRVLSEQMKLKSNSNQSFAVSYGRGMDMVIDLLLQKTLSVDLTCDQWLLVAEYALGSYYFRCENGLDFALYAIDQAERKASTEDNTLEISKLLQTVRIIQQQMIKNKKNDHDELQIEASTVSNEKKRESNTGVRYGKEAFTVINGRVFVEPIQETKEVKRSTDLPYFSYDLAQIVSSYLEPKESNNGINAGMMIFGSFVANHKVVSQKTISYNSLTEEEKKYFEKQRAKSHLSLADDWDSTMTLSEQQHYLDSCKDYLVYCEKNYSNRTSYDELNESMYFYIIEKKYSSNQSPQDFLKQIKEFDFTRGGLLARKNPGLFWKNVMPEFKPAPSQTYWDASQTYWDAMTRDQQQEIFNEVERDVSKRVPYTSLTDSENAYIKYRWSSCLNQPRFYWDIVSSARQRVALNEHKEDVADRIPFDKLPEKEQQVLMLVKIDATAWNKMPSSEQKKKRNELTEQLVENNKQCRIM